MPGVNKPGTQDGHAALGRLISRIEQGRIAPEELEKLLPPPPEQRFRIGITGSPGVGKSTLVNQLIALYRSTGHKVGVVAVDPTSPFSGGAVLGDRIRFISSSQDSGVFIRSLASRGSMGGVAPSASLVASALESAGYGRVLIETVGVGQTGYDIICLADTVVAMFSPESGDAVQLLKAGILEVGDIYVVNKSDRPGAEMLCREIRLSLDADPSASEVRHHGGQGGSPATGEQHSSCEWEPPVLMTCADEGAGTAELVRAIDSHQAYLAGLEQEHPRRLKRIRSELSFILKSRLAEEIESGLQELINRLALQIAAGEISQWVAAEQLSERFDLR